jgi:hypothetical protein
MPASSFADVPTSSRILRILDRLALPSVVEGLSFADAGYEAVGVKIVVLVYQVSTWALADQPVSSYATIVRAGSRIRC